MIPKPADRGCTCVRECSVRIADLSAQRQLGWPGWLFRPLPKTTQATARSLQLHMLDDRLISDHLLFLFPPREKRAGQMSPPAGHAPVWNGWSRHRHSPAAPSAEAPPPGPAAPISGMRPYPFHGGKKRRAGSPSPHRRQSPRARPAGSRFSSSRRRRERRPRLLWNAARAARRGRRPPAELVRHAAVFGSLFSPPAPACGVEQNKATSLSEPSGGTTRGPEARSFFAMCSVVA
ncbi:hypothetical protein PVAP13_9NG567714 [Panicum virgatum]|uniref:Uncharacterized protein n=1 Tax=Panicum virgatum TaxID=38727 RepID=A0A8T0MY54_PANVG|nr:hypothetical protein PVAP13_9NG567714 [Panicum virgatum]